MKRALLSATILVPLCLALGSWETLASRDSDAEAEKLLKQAEEFTDIRSNGSHPFRLVAHVQLTEEKNQVREGTYLLVWKSPTIWRDETSFDDFSQVRVADRDKLFVSRKPPSLTLDIFHLFQLLDFPSHLRSSPEAKAKKLQERNKNGSRERTVEIALPGEPSWKTLFLDLASPTPTRVEYKHSHVEHEFKDYVEFYGHKFPRTLVELDSNRPLIQVELEELADAAGEASSFVPPPDAHWLHWCKDPEPAKPVGDWLRTGIPIPQSLRTDLRKHVDIYGIIGTDGQWHNLTVVKSAGKEVDSYWLKAMAIQRFLPATCGDTAIAEESVTEFYLP